MKMLFAGELFFAKKWWHFSFFDNNSLRQIMNESTQHTGIYHFNVWAHVSLFVIVDSELCVFSFICIYISDISICYPWLLRFDKSSQMVTSWWTEPPESPSAICWSKTIHNTNVEVHSSCCNGCYCNVDNAQCELSTFVKSSGKNVEIIAGWLLWWD